MKKCAICGKEYPDKVKFCVKCGKPLEEAGVKPAPQSEPKPEPKPNSIPEPKPVPNPEPKSEPAPQPVQSQYQAPRNNQSNTSTGINSFATNNNLNNAAGKSKSGSKGLLIGVIIALGVVILAATAVIIIILTKDDTPNQVSQQTQINESVVPESNNDIPASEEPDNEDSIESEEKEEVSEPQDISEYQQYYDSIEDTFGKYIMSGTESGQYSAYLGGLGTALSGSDVKACEYNYNQLKSLEETLEISSKERITKLQNEMKKLKAKASTKKVAKSVSFIKAETEAQIAADSGDYKKAKSKYDSCIKKLKKAAKSKKKKKSNDDYYKSSRRDDTTQEILYTRRLTDSEVRSLGAEKKRYYMNTLFAIYGYRFNNKTIQSFFDNQSWYYPDTSVAVGDQQTIKSYFNDNARYNYRKLGGE